MRRIAWAFTALAGLAIACGPTGQTEVKPPADLQSKGEDAGNAPEKKNARAKSANTNDMPSMKPVD